MSLYVSLEPTSQISGSLLGRRSVGHGLVLSGSSLVRVNASDNEGGNYSPNESILTLQATCFWNIFKFSRTYSSILLQSHIYWFIRMS